MGMPQWQADRKGGSLAGYANYVNLTTMQFHQLFGECKSNACAFILLRVCIVCLIEPVEYRGESGGADANAGIGYPPESLLPQFCKNRHPFNNDAPIGLQ